MTIGGSETRAMCAVGIVLALAGTSCRIRSGTTPYWQETRGQARFKALTANRKGALVLNLEGTALYRYPGEFGRPWIEEARLDAALVASSPEAIYVTDSHGLLHRHNRGGDDDTVLDFAGSETWRIAAMSASDTDALYVVADGRVRAVRNEALAEDVCPGAKPKAIAASGADLVWVVTEGGDLLRGQTGSCTPTRAPPALAALSAFGSALTVVDGGGSVYRRGPDGWRELDPPVRYRPNAFPETTRIVGLAQSELWLWARDEGGYVYVLSDPT
jgi:hypothetical protein